MPESLLPFFWHFQIHVSFFGHIQLDISLRDPKATIVAIPNQLKLNAFIHLGLSEQNFPWIYNTVQSQVKLRQVLYAAVL